MEQAARSQCDVHPAVAFALCSALVFPARIPGHELGAAFRDLVNQFVSRIDWLFDLVVAQDASAVVYGVQAWGVWIIDGIACGAMASGATRLLLRRRWRRPWLVALLVVLVWTLVRAAVWNWDAEFVWLVSGALLGSPPAVYGPWPLAGSVGFLGGLAGGLFAAAWALRGPEVRTV